MFEKHKYKILATVFILVLLGAGTFYYLKKKREKKEAEEKKAALAAEQKEKENQKALAQNPITESTTTPSKKELQVAGEQTSGKPV
jgi:uncharacterized protein HemX